MENLVTFLLTALCFLCQTSNCKDYSSCGLRSVRRGKIFGGLESRSGMWPWQVAILRGTSDEGQGSKFICGGALINSRWVLSAAHCFQKRPHETFIHYSYAIKAGEHRINSKDPHEQERNAFRIHNHPNFIPSTYENDIALIELVKGVKMGPYVRSICLPKVKENLSAPGKKVSVAGWGFTTKGSHSSVLLHSAFRIQSNKICKDTTSYLFNETVMFCAGHGKGGNDTCKGDSGGSTVREVLRDGRRRWVTVGLVSWGEGCGIKGKYGYYTIVEPFVPWIQNKINGSILSCGNPGDMLNGRIIGSDFLVGFTVKYTCNEGYQLRGRPRSRCKRNGKWTKAPTCVKVECRDPGGVRHGFRRPRRKKYHYKDKIRFRCKTNYTIIGRSAMMCRSDGMWSGFKPACLAPCKDPGIPEGGVRLDNSFKHGETVRFLCRKRNQAAPVSYLTCTNGRWNQNIPKCIADCNDPGIPTNGQRRGDDFTLKKRVYFTCNRGYMRVGPEYLQCQNNRRWSDKAPICEPLSCTRPIPPENAFIYSRGVMKEKYGFNEVAMFHCNKGYLAFGSPFVRCLADGWSRTNLRCPPKNCGDPGTPTNARRQGNVFTFNSKVNFTCDGIGFELKGSAQRVCQENGTWSGTRTTCEGVPCSKLQPIQNGTRTPDRNIYVFEDRVQFKCDANYTMDGESVIICQDDRTWSKEVPRCLAPCRDPGIPIGGNRLRHSFLHNSIVQFRCKQGWSMEGSHTIRCVDGRWDHDTPTCSDCGSALGMESGKIPDGNIQALSTRWGYHAKYGRLNGRYAWCSATARDPYLQIDFDKPYKITGLATQGSAYDNKWVDEYTVTSNLAGSSFNVYREANRNKVFIGNRDKSSTVKHRFGKPFVARRLRIHPQKRGGFSVSNPACMRVEIYGCDLPSDCILVGSRVVAKWIASPRGFFKYLKAYLTSTISRYWKVELENEKHGRLAQKYFPKYTDMPFVLDVPPKHEELQVGTRVLAPWGYTYYPCTIKATKDRNNRYHVRADDGDYGYFTIDKLRLLKAPIFCH